MRCQCFSNYNCIKMERLLVLSLNVILISYLIQNANACSGYKLHVDYFRNCGKNDVVQLSDDFQPTLNDDCSVTLWGCTTVKNAFKSAQEFEEYMYIIVIDVAVKGVTNQTSSGLDSSDHEFEQNSICASMAWPLQPKNDKPLEDLPPYCSTMTYEISKNGVVYAGTKNACDALEGAHGEVLDIMDSVGAPRTCPVKEGTICGHGKHVNIRKHRIKLPVMSGTTVGRMELKTNSGDACFEFSATLSRRLFSG